MTKQELQILQLLYDNSEVDCECRQECEHWSDKLIFLRAELKKMIDNAEEEKFVCNPGRFGDSFGDH